MLLERIALLLHILCDLRYNHGITSQRLKNAEQSVRRQIIPVERLELLDELYRARGEEEKFLEGFLNKGVQPRIIPILTKYIKTKMRLFLFRESISPHLMTSQASYRPTSI